MLGKKNMDSDQKVRVTKRFHFEMAHALRCHDGLCANIHGHSYVLDVTLEGIPKIADGHPKNGMVIDFAELKALVNTAVVKDFDHHLLLQEGDRGAWANGADTFANGGLFGRTRFTPWQPSCENVLLDIVARLKRSLPEPTALCAVRLQETATSWAEWGRD